MAVQRALTATATLKAASYLPSRPRFARRLTASPTGAWGVEPPALPEALRSVPGIVRDPAAEQAAFEEQPLHDLRFVFPEVYRWEEAINWTTHLPVAVRRGRAMRAVARTRRLGPSRKPAPIAPETLTRELKGFAGEVGLAATGVAAYDEKYTFAEYLGTEAGDRVIVSIVEQQYEATDRTPSDRTNRASFDSEVDCLRGQLKLAEWLRSRGYRAHCHSTYEMVLVQYGVVAGLGQMGLNGQLLTPAAGPRCRLEVMTTDAPLVVDEPVDYGIPRICDSCQVCVRRCPAGAIPNKRKMYRGVEKAKIKIGRCFPIVNQVAGCGICMKVCPVQKFGLPAVVEEFERTGKVLGKDTDELEGFDWPLDGRHYGPGAKPRVPRSFYRAPDDVPFDPEQTTPVAAARHP
jgi:ferredoxin